jgi:hypothetical protein
VWQRHKVVFSALCLAFVALVFFTVRLISSTIYWSDPAHRFQKLEPWMTPAYISQSYKIESNELSILIGIDGRGSKRLSLEKIAQMRGINVKKLMDELQPALDQRTGKHGD